MRHSRGYGGQEFLREEKTMSRWLKRVFTGDRNGAENRPGPVVRAEWNGQVIAESDQTVVIEGNHYFPPGAVRRKYLRDSETTTICSWKGTANYYSLDVDGQTNKDAAWYYADPKSAASEIRGRIAFWRGVEITTDRQPGRRAPSS